MERPIYVIDTNILVDYPDIIPPVEGAAVNVREPTVDLSSADIVIPTAVVRELSSFKREKSERGRVARKILRRLREHVEGASRPMGASYRMLAPTMLNEAGVGLSILPVHKNFRRALPFNPSDDDMDGQIILAVLTVVMLRMGLPIDGTATTEEVMMLGVQQTDITLLTNDNGLAIRARERGIRTSRYGYRMPEPYIGRREVVVTSDLMKYFLSEGKIERDIWKMEGLTFEQERHLAANEFVIMRLDDDVDSDSDMSHFENVGRYDENEDAIVRLKYAPEFPMPLRNVGQAIYAEALMNPAFAAVVCTGPAGSGKTYMATIYGYTACARGDFIGVVVVPCESRSTIGALPGDLNEKMRLDVRPLKNALRNYMLKNDRSIKTELASIRAGRGPYPLELLWQDGEQEIAHSQRSLKQRLEEYVEAIWDYWFMNIPIENARGLDFTKELAIYDEFQDQNPAQADTLIKRLGQDGKIVLTGDLEQIHAPYLDAFNNGLTYASQLLYNNPMVARVHFTEDEVIRHPLVRMIAERQKAQRIVERYAEPALSLDGGREDIARSAMKFR